MPCLLCIKSSCCIFLFEVNAKTCPNFLLIFSQKVVIRFCLFFSSCAHPCYILCLLSLKYTHVTETPILHRYRHIGMPYIQAKYVTFACCGFSLNVHPLSMHASAYKLLPPPLQTKAKNRLQLVCTACNWNFATCFLGSGLFSYKMREGLFTSYMSTHSKRHSCLRFPFPPFVFIVAKRNRLHPATFGNVLPKFGKNRLKLVLFPLCARLR